MVIDSMRLKNSRLVELAVHAAVLCVFLAAQAMAFGHPLDLDAHSNGEPCTICVSLAGLGSAVVAKADRHLPRAVCTVAQSPDLVIVEPLTSESPPARGPPR